MRLLILIRAIIALILALVCTAIHCVVLLCTISFVKNKPAYCDKHIWLWAHSLCRIYNIDLKVEGLENLPKTGCVFVFNHTSNFDIPIVHAAIKKTFRFGAKIELFRIPIFASAMRACGALPIARGERAKVLKVYQDSVPRLHQGESFILAAEGTRNTVRDIGEKFKAGPFIFAIEGQVPIVPVVIIGAFEIHAKTDWIPSIRRYRNPVKVKILPPVSTLGHSEDSRKKLQEDVRVLMTASFEAG